MGDTGRTPASIFREQSVDLDPGGAKFRQALTETVHSLFEVRKLSKELVRLRDVFTGKDVDVFERRQPAGLRKGDFLEARLLPVDGQWLFSRSFCFHPEEAKKPIFKELKRLKKFEPEFSRPEFIRALSNMRLKLERYRNIAIDDIYDFGRRVP